MTLDPHVKDLQKKKFSQGGNQETSEIDLNTLKTTLTIFTRFNLNEYVALISKEFKNRTHYRAVSN